MVNLETNPDPSCLHLPTVEGDVNEIELNGSIVFNFAPIPGQSGSALCIDIKDEEGEEHTYIGAVLTMTNNQVDGGFGMGAKITDTADLIADASVTQGDGRTPITGENVNDLKGHVDLMVTDLEANNNAKLNILLTIEVNGSP